MWRNIKNGAAKYLPLIHQAKEICIFDTETTGFKKTDKIIQFSAIRFRVLSGYRLAPVSEMDIYINPEEPLTPKITEITGITDKMLETAKTEAELAPLIFRFLQGCPLWGAYNAAFDLRMLRQMAERTGLAFQVHETFDILEMARDCISKDELGDHKLSAVMQYLFPDENIQFHSSIEDVKATGMCFSAFCAQYRAVLAEPAQQKRQVYLEWASPWENPHNGMQKRVKLKLSEGQYGDIFWDIVNKGWNCKKTAPAQKLFKEIDMANIEQQLLNKYGWRYRTNDISELCAEWMKDKKNRDREKREEQPKAG